MRLPVSSRVLIAALIGLAWLSPTVAVSGAAVQQRDLEIAADNGRVVPTRVFAPTNGCDDCALVIFSHGAFSTYDRYDALLLPWTEAGFVVAAPLHVDSEAHPNRDDYPQDAALPTRVDDYLALRDRLTEPARLQSMGVSLSGEVIAAGHSFGALIAQIAGGANPPTVSGEVLAALAAQAPGAVVAISPPPAMKGYIDSSHWSQIGVPMLVVTGTTDVIPNFVSDWRDHLLSYEAASDDRAYALVFDGADHYFNGAFGRPTPQGERMEAVIGSLNQSIIAFIHAVEADASPVETPAWRALPDSVRQLSEGGMIVDE
ncbi:MAG: alpha/beta hydrolase [Chromatocurvus sp.]